jgi:hypothetical protein
VSRSYFLPISCCLTPEPDFQCGFECDPGEPIKRESNLYGFLSDDDRFVNGCSCVSLTDLPEPRGVLREPALGGDCGNAHLPGVHSDGVGPPLGACLAHHQQ